ncbi:ATP-binding cassette domain-containing protein [Acetobacteraceae bacterium H6797]|nr:ATP-binding cassette domain-containing protein [Acetobacteraceae bacterium H6797]
MTPLYSLRDLAFSAGGKQILSSLTLDIGAGGVTGLLGHNGSGKSTLIKLLARQLSPQGGSIDFQGRPLQAWGKRELARLIAYLPQQLASAEGMLVRELVALGRYPWHGALGRFREADRLKVQEALEITHMTSLADRMVDSLSGGERQRAWLAMTLAQDARCLLLDEPTAALDIAHQVEVLSLVRRLSQERGLSVIVVLHDVNMAARYCDDVLAMRNGALKHRGVPSTLMASSVLREIYDVSMDAVSDSQGRAVAFPS